MITETKNAATTVAAVWGLLLLSLGLGIFLDGCGSRPPSNVPPAAHAVGVEVFTATNAVANAHVVLAQGGPTYEGDTDLAGYRELGAIPITASNEWRVWVTAAGCTPYSELVHLAPVDQILRVGSHDVHPNDVPLPPLDCPPPVPPAPVLTDRIRVVNGHFNFLWLGVSEFDAIHLVRTGQEEELSRRLARDVHVGARTIVRVFARAANLFDLNDSQPGYWEASDRAIALINAAGMYVELVLNADAQSLDTAARHRLLQTYAQRYGSNIGVVFQIANEPQFNGWSSAVDPDLLRLAEELASYLGHRDFSIGDAPDGDDADASAETVAQSVTLGKHANIIVIHSSRKGGAQPEAERYRRYIDHGESFYDVMTAVRQVNPQAACVNDEPMGVASVRFVPLGGGKTYEREFEPEAVLADELTTLSIGCGHTFHYISAQNDGVTGLDLLGQISPRFPIDWSYRNDSWGGSATRGYTGFGKVRTVTNGSDAFVTANGTNTGGVTWANGFHPVETLFDGAHVTVWRAAH